MAACRRSAWGASRSGARSQPDAAGFARCRRGLSRRAPRRWARAGPPGDGRHLRREATASPRDTAALAGGTEACITWGCLKAWEALRVLARDALRPFSAQRSGLVLGEGAGILVLEEREQAIARGADILAEIIGYGASSDAADMVHPSDEGAALAMSRALDDAGVSPTEIDYVSAHGSGTPPNDPTATPPP